MPEQRFWRPLYKKIKECFWPEEGLKFVEKMRCFYMFIRVYIEAQWILPL